MKTYIVFVVYSGFGSSDHPERAFPQNVLQNILVDIFVALLVHTNIQASS